MRMEKFVRRSLGLLEAYFVARSVRRNSRAYATFIEAVEQSYETVDQLPRSGAVIVSK